MAVLLKKIISWLFFTSLLFTTNLQAQKRSNNLQAEEDLGNEDTIKAPKYVDPIIVPITASESRKQCQQYEGKYISHYSNVYKVKNCQRKLINTDEIYELSKKKIKIYEVGNQTIRALKLYVKKPQSSYKKSKALCKKLEKQYITLQFENIFYVENCKKRAFDNWSSYESHRGKLDYKKKTVIFNLTWEEFSSLKDGKPMPSTLDADFKKQLSKQREPDLIPIDEACEGIEGQYAYYYSKLYKIQNCHKRVVILDSIKNKKKFSKLNIKEMTSEQWMSLPDAAPIKKKGTPKEVPYKKKKERL